jgi:muconate cycloisomerase
MMTSLTVDRIDTVILDLPLQRAHQFSVTTIDHQTVLLVQLRTSDGIVGLGEATVPGGPWWGGDAIESIRALIDGYLAPALRDWPVGQIAGAARRMDRVAHANWVAKSAVEMALHDALGKALGVPAYQLLGGLFRASLPVTWALGATDADAVVEEAEAKLDAGLHSSFKLKMGASDPADDVARVLKITAALAGRASVRVDLNGAWDESTASRWLPELERGGVDLVEQPVPGWAVDGMARLCAQLDVPIMADESVRTLHDAFRVTQQRAGDVIALKAPKSGGLARTQALATVAEAAGVPCHGGTAIESSIGTSASLHAYCALPAVTWGCELFGPHLLREEVVSSGPTYGDGHIHVRHAPGLGVELDEAQVKELRRS